jgi:competence protein ComFC
VPPTRTRRIQPVFQIADELASRFGVSAGKDMVRKLKNVAELKNIHEFEERRKVLENAFRVEASYVSGAQVLLVDDLMRSGATMSAVAEALTYAGAAAVYAFALTQTRRI